MSIQLQIKGYLYPGGSCADACTGSKGAISPFELSFRNCAESFGQMRSGDYAVRTTPGEYIALPGSEQFSSIELLALKTSAELELRLDGLPAIATTSALYPVAGLSALTLDFGVDGYPVAVTFAAGDDTAEEVARRINSFAALAGVPFRPASVTTTGQVEIRGLKTGPTGVLTAFTGTAAAALGLDAFPGSTGSGSDLTVDGLQVWQFPRAGGVSRIEVSGQASVSVLAAGS